MEQWKVIPSLNGKYEASNEGRVRNAETKYILKPRKGTYPNITIRIEDKKICFTIHILVAETFIGVKPKGLIVNHKDGNKWNNEAENLEYTTYKDNNLHALNTGLRKAVSQKLYAPKGEKSPHAKTTEKQVREILQIKKELGYGKRKISKMTGVNNGIVSCIIGGKSWKHIYKEFFPDNV